MGLSVGGIALQIMSSVAAFRENQEFCTENDCKVVVNHLIRKYSEPGVIKKYKSKAVSSGVYDRTIKDHAVPVICLVNLLLELPLDKLVVNKENISDVVDILNKLICIVEITPSEDAKLTSLKLRQNMPVDWVNIFKPTCDEIFSRYAAAGIEIVDQPAR